VLGYELNENTTFTSELHARNHDHVSRQRRHTRRVSLLPDLPVALTERDACTSPDASPIDEGHVSDAALAHACSHRVAAEI